MAIMYRYYAICMLSMFIVRLDSVQGQTTSAEEYLLCFMGGGVSTVEYPDSGSCVFIASYADTANVTITCRAYPGFRKLLQVPPYSHIKYDIWRDIDPEIESSEVVDDRVVLVTSDHPITCGFRQLLGWYPCDGTVAYPLKASDTLSNTYSYLAMSYPVDKDPWDTTERFLPSEIAVAAFVDSTLVTIVPTSTTTNDVDSGNELTFRLNRGQCVQLYSSVKYFKNYYDLTGTPIRSNHPIAVYGGNGGTSIPSSYGYGSRTADPAPFLEAIPSLSSWGTMFLSQRHAPRAPGFPTLEFTEKDSIYDVLRVLSARGGTTILANGEPWVTLDAGQYRDTAIKGPILL